MHDDVNKERYHSRNLACIYLWICVVRTIRQRIERSGPRRDSLGLLEYIFRLLSRIAAIGVEHAKPTTLDLTHAVLSARRRNTACELLQHSQGFAVSRRGANGPVAADPAVRAAAAVAACRQRGASMSAFAIFATRPPGRLEW